MSDLKIAKQSKSKSNNVKSTKLATQSPANSNGTTKPVNVPLAKKQSKTQGTPGSIIDKLDLGSLKETAIKSMRKKSGNPPVPQTREACIEYALDMVVGNLIQNGHLRPKKAQKMKSPVMIAQIGEIVDDMISAKAEISIASTATYFRRKKKSSKSKSDLKSKSRSRSQQKMQKWAIQPAALPITIVTNHQSLTNLPKFTTLEKIAMSTKEHGSAKSPKNASTESVKKQKSRSKSKNKTKSLDSSSEHKEKQQTPQQPPLPATTQKERHYPPPASSEVPSSNHSLENDSKRLSNTTNNVPDPASNDNSKVEQQTAQKKAPELEEKKAPEPTKQVEDSNRNVTPPPPAAPPATNDNIIGTSEDNRKNKEDVRDQAQAPAQAQSSPQTTVEDRNQIFSPLPVNATVRTLNTLINNTTPCSSNTLSTTLPAYQTMVDMKGFQNDEISMEVEGRQLIFLASRPKRDELNVRKVTEIVEVPVKVKMENLKIGRRTDGYVIIEEHDT